MSSVILRKHAGKWRVTLSTGEQLYECHENAYGAARTVAKREARARGLPLVDTTVKAGAARKRARPMSASERLAARRAARARLLAGRRVR